MISRHRDGKDYGHTPIRRKITGTPIKNHKQYQTCVVRKHKGCHRDPETNHSTWIKQPLVRQERTGHYRTLRQRRQSPHPQPPNPGDAAPGAVGSLRETLEKWPANRSATVLGSATFSPAWDRTGGGGGENFSEIIRTLLKTAMRGVQKVMEDR